MNTTAISICTRDRATEVFGLLISLRNQTYQDFDIYILDDASGTPLPQFHFINVMIARLRHEGHRCHIIRNEKSKGISKARQQIINYIMQQGDYSEICRLDDDTILAPDYLELLKNTLQQGYDIASGVTPPIVNPTMEREIQFVTPIINRVVLSDEGKFLINNDDCGHTYDTPTILPAHHFRSNAMIKTTVHKKVKYDDILALHGFREEQFFSMRAILAGFTIGVHTQAIAWHLVCPSGGERRPEIIQRDSLMNQQLLNKKTRQWYERHGDFIRAYNKKLGITETRAQELATQHKNTNLLYTTEE